MEALRPLSILPAIKCSACGAEIEISCMGEHVCAPTSQGKEQMTVSKPTSPTAATSQQSFKSSEGEFSAMLASTNKASSSWIRTQRSASASGTARVVPKSTRTAPPRIDPAAANKPYTQRDLLTPGPPPSSAMRSPTTPHTADWSRKPPVVRSMTSPVPRIYRPPSPKMSSNLDCAFPPFPTSRPPTLSSKPKNAGSATAGNEQSTLGAGLHAEPESYFGPRSPRTTGGADVMQRMNSIAPGPFDTRIRSSSDDGSSGSRSPTPKMQSEATFRTDQRAASQSPGISKDLQSPKSPPAQVQAEQARPSPPAFVSIAPPTPTNREGRPVPQRPVRPEPLDGFLVMLKTESEASARAGNLVDLPSNVTPLMQAATTTPQLRVNDAIPQVVPSAGNQPVAVSSPTPAPAIASSWPNSGGREPQMPKAARQGIPSIPPILTTHAPTHQQTIHAPSDSESSTSSTRSYGRGSVKSDVSPPISATSSVSMLSTTLDESVRDHDRDQDPSLAVPSLQIRTKSSQSQPRSDVSRQTTSGQFLQEVPTPQSESPAVGLPNVYRQMDLPESPVVPSIQGAYQQPQQRPAARQDPPPHVPVPLAPRSKEDSMSRSPTNRTSAKRPGTASRHHCRGCKEPITGKSVKAADGRLTGRWHKQCFVCRTCHSPFATADFYVINNDPYCEQHYHKLNNSLCAKCDHGIEGPYLDTQQGQKFHPACFTCIECRKVLSDDYFEINGSVYCEQHAVTQLRRQEGLGPKRNMERRRTRLMMMGDSH